MSEYLNSILLREMVDYSAFSPVRQCREKLRPAIETWGSGLILSIEPSGSFAKGTANHSGTDIDLFISLSEAVTTPLADVYSSLFDHMSVLGFNPKRQNVSIGVTLNGFDVDLVPGKRQNAHTQDHSLYSYRVKSWRKTNIANHIALVRGSGRIDEIRLLKLWRKQKLLDFPSFYLELVVIEALKSAYLTSLERNLQTVFEYIGARFLSARFEDPANSANVLSDELTVSEKTAIVHAAARAAAATNWREIVT